MWSGEITSCEREKKKKEKQEKLEEQREILVRRPKQRLWGYVRGRARVEKGDKLEQTDNEAKRSAVRKKRVFRKKSLELKKRAQLAVEDGLQLT